MGCPVTEVSETLRSMVFRTQVEGQSPKNPVILTIVNKVSECSNSINTEDFLAQLSDSHVLMKESVRLS
jgi:hypothetical protein